MEVFKYLGRLLAQDDNDIRVIRAQPRKARATWARVGQVLRAENVPPHVAGGVCAALWQQNMGPFNDLFGKSSGVPHPCSLPNGGEAQAAEGPRTRVDLPEVKGCVGKCGMSTLAEYITVHRQTFTVYVATRSVLIECRRGE